MSLVPTPNRGGNAVLSPGRLNCAAWWAPSWATLVLLGMLFGGGRVARAQDAELEYKVKAGFLYNFINFVEWPTNKLAASDKEFVVGCLPEDPAAPILARILEGKTAEGRKIRLVILRESDEISGCHLLFLGRTRGDQVEQILTRLKQAPVLTVSELDGFGQRGGMINFVRHERTFRFEVNLGATERAGLRISSKLASMATIVKTTNPP